MPVKSKSMSVPEAILPRYQEIIALTDGLCQEKLNAEYATCAENLQRH